MNAPTWPRIGDIFIPPQCGWHRVVAVEGDTVTLRAEHDGSLHHEPIADFSHRSTKWRHYTPDTSAERAQRHTERVRSTSDFMSESERQDMRDAGRGHLVR